MSHSFHNQVSTAQAVTSTAVSVDSVELGTAGFPRDIGAGENIYLNVFATTTFTDSSGTDATLTVQVIGATDAALTSGIVVLGSSDAFGVTAPSPLVIPANPTAGGVPARPISVRVNPNMFSTGTRFIGARYVVASGPMSGGAVTAWFAPNQASDSLKFYPSGWTVGG